MYFQSTVGSDRRLQLELINLLIDYLDLDAAVEWALYFELPVETVPHQISSQLQARQLYDTIGFLPAFLMCLCYIGTMQIGVVC